MRSGQPLTVFVQNNRSRSQWYAVARPRHRPRSPELRAGLRRRTTPCSARPISGSIRRRSCCSRPGTFGNTGRGDFIGPDLRTLDLALSKTRRLGALGGDGRLELRIEVFNLFNRANFGIPELRRLRRRGRRRSAARDASAASATTVTSARQMQLGVRAVF